MPYASLRSIPERTRVFLDSNVLVYAITRRSGECCILLDRCYQEEVFGFVSAEVIHEVTHKLMLVEAADRRFIAEERASLLMGKPDIVAGLRWYWNEVSGLLVSPILVLETGQAEWEAAQRIREGHGLLTSDSLIAATMARHRLTGLATNDRAFERVGGLTVYRPTDL